jgi:hypothetical protein
MKAINYLKMAEVLEKFHPEAYRFLSKVEIDNATGCWNWKHSVRRDYGRFKLHGKFEGAHRISYLFFKGPIDEGMLICHNCDNPRCVNPEHLFQGTHQDNAVDAYQKGRMVLPENSAYFKEGHLPENRGLSDDIVRLIKMDISDGMLSLIKISKRHGVKYQTVRDIKSGRSYINIQ